MYHTIHLRSVGGWRNFSKIAEKSSSSPRAVGVCSLKANLLAPNSFQMFRSSSLGYILFWKYDQSCIFTRDIVCPYRGTVIPPLKKRGIFRVVVCAQVVHSIVFITFFCWGFVTCTTVTEKFVSPGNICTLYYVVHNHKKMEHHHGGADCQVQRHGYCNYSFLLMATSLLWVGQGCCQRILFNYVNWLRKKIISTLIYFILFFNLLQTWLHQNWFYFSPLTTPPSCSSCSIPPPSHLCVFGWLLHVKYHVVAV